MKRYALRGKNSRTLLTYGGRVLVHDNKAEMEYLTVGADVVDCPSDIPPEETFSLLMHPNYSFVRLPLTRDQFR